MGKALADAFPICRETLRGSRRGARRAAQPPLLRRARGSADADREHAAGDSGGQHRRLPPARSRGLAPAFVAGHSLGEYSANVAAGTFAFADALRIVRRRGRYMQEAVPVGDRRDGGDPRPRRRDRSRRRAPRPPQGEVVSPANLNGAGQVVIAGARDAVARAGERAKALGAKRVVPLPVSAPFHCALMKPAAGPPRARAARAGGRTTRACRSSPTSTPSRNATRAAAIEALVAQVSSPVRWEAVVRAPCVGGRHNVC